MKFIKILLWVALIIFLIIFSVNSWEPATVSIGLGSVLITKLPVLVIISLLIGFLPLYIWHRIVKWRLNKKLNLAGVSISKAPHRNGTVPKQQAPKQQTNSPRAGISPLESKTSLESE